MSRRSFTAGVSCRLKFMNRSDDMELSELPALLVFNAIPVLSASWDGVASLKVMNLLSVRTSGVATLYVNVVPASGIAFMSTFSRPGLPLTCTSPLTMHVA